MGVSVNKRPLKIAVALLGFLIIAGAVGPFLAPYDHKTASLLDSLTPPNSDHLLGTDFLGRDVLSRVLASLRLNIFGALLSAVVASVLALAFARDKRRPKPWEFWRLAGIGLLVIVLGGSSLAAIVSAAFGTGVTFVLISVTAGLLPWVLLVIQKTDARFRLPVWVLSWAWAMILLAILGFLGLGVPPPQSELGDLIRQSLDYAEAAPWLIWSPSATLAMMLAVLLVSAYLLSRYIRKPPLTD